MKSSFGAACAMLVTAGSLAVSSAQNIYWGAAGGTNAWSTTANWYADAGETTPAGSAPGATSDVIFNTTPDSGLNSSVTFSATSFARSLTFANSGSMLLTQNGSLRNLIIGSGGITVNSGAGQTTLGVSTNTLRVQVLENQTWTNNSANTLNVRAVTASDLATGPVVLTYNAAGTGNITASLAYTDSNFAGSTNPSNTLGIVVDSVGTGTVSLVSSTYSGGTQVRRGTLVVSGSIGSGAVTVGHTSGSDAARLILTGVAANGITVQAGSSGTAALLGNTGGDYQGNILLNRDVLFGSAASSAQTVLYSGDISGTGNISIARGGSNNPTVILSGDNTYTGKTSIDSAIVVVNSINSVSGGSASSSLGAPITAANGTITMSTVAASTLRYVGSGETTDRIIEIASNSGAVLDQSGSGLLRFTSNLAHAGSGARTLTLTGTTAGSGEFAGIIGDNGANTAGVTKSGSGVWRLSGSNTYTGATAVNGGVLEVTKLSNGGVASSIGAASNVATNLLFSNGGTLRYVGAGDSTDRRLRIGTTGPGITLDASGSGAVTFSNTGLVAFQTAGNAYTVTLTGANTGTNTVAANFANNGAGLLSIVKEGNGTWNVTGASTHTGGTTVTAGTLLVNGSLQSGVTVNGGVLGGSGAIAGAVTVADGATIAPGNSAGTLNTGTFSLTGTSSRIALEISGTAPTQYDRISVTGGVNLDGNGGIEITLLSFMPVPTDLFFVVVNDGGDAISGTLYGLAQGATFSSGGATWQVSYLGDAATNSFTGGNDLVLQMVPEPGTVLLAVGGLLGCAAFRRRRLRR